MEARPFIALVQCDPTRVCLPGVWTPSAADGNIGKKSIDPLSCGY